MSTNRLVEKGKAAAYASALLKGAQEQGGQDAVMEVRDQAQVLLYSLRGNADLNEALANESMTGSKRNEFARNLFADFNPVLRDVVALMAERGEVSLLTRTMNSFEELLREDLSITVVDVTTVVELDDHLRDLIKKKAASEFGTDVVLREHIDKSLLGGILMSTNGKRIDASVRSQLENARTVLKQTADGGEC